MLVVDHEKRVKIKITSKNSSAWWDDRLYMEESIKQTMKWAKTILENKGYFTLRELYEQFGLDSSSVSILDGWYNTIKGHTPHVVYHIERCIEYDNGPSPVYYISVTTYHYEEVADPRQDLPYTVGDSIHANNGKDYVVTQVDNHGTFISINMAELIKTR